jgi:uncharacterized protein with NRDE domain
MNDHGVVAAILNRSGSLGPADGKRSRGELVLDALDFADAREAAEAIGDLDAGAYRSFNLVIADNEDAFWIKGLGRGAPIVAPAPTGVSVLTAHDLNDTAASPRARHYLPLFEARPIPDPETSDWAAWEALLASKDMAPGEFEPNAAIHVETDYGFGTVSSSVMALPNRNAENLKPHWRFARVWPEREAFTTVMP